MRQPLARYRAPVSFVHALSLADFITTIVGFEVFGTHRLGMRKLKIVVALVASLTLPASAVAGTVTFTDNFSPPATLWSNSSGI